MQIKKDFWKSGHYFDSSDQLSTEGRRAVHIAYSMLAAGAKLLRTCYKFFHCNSAVLLHL